MNQLKWEKTYIFEAKEIYDYYLKTTKEAINQSLNKINKEDLINQMSDMLLEYYLKEKDNILIGFTESLINNTKLIEEWDFYSNLKYYLGESGFQLLGPEFQKILKSNEQWSVKIVFNTNVYTEFIFSKDDVDPIFYSKIKN